MTTFRCCFFALFAATGALVASPSVTDAQESAPATSRWEAAISKFEEQDAQHPPKPGGVVFVGSSSIRMWDLKSSFPELDAMNRGFGGSQLSDVVQFADRIVLPYKPRLVIVYAGDNDLAANKAPERVVEDYRRLVELVHKQLPDTRIAFIAVKPSISRWALIDQVRAVNRAVAAIAAQDERLAFIDIEAPMLGDDGLPRKDLFLADGLHLNAEGYKLWTEQVRPVLEVKTR